MVGNRRDDSGMAGKTGEFIVFNSACCLESTTKRIAQRTHEFYRMIYNLNFLMKLNSDLEHTYF